MSAFVANPGEAIDWGDVASWVGAAVPSSGASNYIVFPGGYRYVFTGANMNQAAVNVAGIIVQRGAHVEIPGLTIDVNQAGGEGIVVYGSGGEVRIAGGSTTQALNYSRHCRVRLEGGTHPVVHGENGGYTYIGDATAEEVVAIGAQIEVAYKADRIQAEVANGGLIRSYRSVEAGSIGRGRLDLLGAAAITDGGTGGEVTLLDPEAVLRMEHDAAVVHRSILARIGTVDPSRCQVPPTWTYLYRSPTAKVIEKCLVGRVTVTNRKGYGGEGESMGVQE